MPPTPPTPNPPTLPSPPKNPTSSSAPQPGGLPKVLVTGFSLFGNNSINPSEQLINHISANPTLFSNTCQLKTLVLKVEYQGLIQTVSESISQFSPDISIHFGLSGRANGITLEKIARNSCAPHPDVIGYVPTSTICQAGKDIPSTLPLEAIETRLKEKGIKCSYSEDAGGYLCNYIFYISRSGLCPGLDSKVSGFIHIPPLREGGAMDKPNAMDMAEIIEAGKIVIEESIKAFQQLEVEKEPIVPPNGG